MSLAMVRRSARAASRRRTAAPPVIPPLPTAGLVARFDAAQGVTASAGRVSAWADQSGNGNDATQATAPEQPFAATDYLGRPVVRFAAINTTSGTIGESNTGNTQGTSLGFAATHTFDARGYSVFIAGRVTFPNSSTLFISPASTVGLLRQNGSTSVAATMYAGARNTTVLPRLNPSAYGVTSGASSVTAHSNLEDVTAGLAAITAGTGAGATLGRLSAAAGYSTFEALEVIVYDGQLSLTDAAAVKAYLVAKYELRTAEYTKNILFEGDSITYGLNIPHHSYPVRVLRPTTADWRMVNLGASGATLTSIAARAAAADQYRRPSYPRNVLLVMSGRNDAAASVTGADYYAALVAYVQARITAGWEVWVGTSLAAGNTGINTLLQDYNARIRGTTGAGIVADAGANRVIDFGALPEFDTQADASNLTYFQSDTTHPTAAGAALMADLVAAQLAA